MSNGKKRNPWSWIPTLYYAEGIPYVVVMTLAVLLYKKLGVSNTDVAIYTSWLYLPWVIKPFWSPIVDIIKSNRWWVVSMQLLIGAAIAGVAFTIPTEGAVSTVQSLFNIDGGDVAATDFLIKSSLAFMWLLAFSSATHDIAADGFYLKGLDSNEQVLFIGIRSTFYRIAMISGQGLFVMAAGYLETHEFFGIQSSIPMAWSLLFYMIAALFILFFAYHWRVLPKPEQGKNVKKFSDVFVEFAEVFRTFFAKKEIWTILGVLLLYRLGESQLVKMATPFLIDPRSVGGLGLSTVEYGAIYGTVGVICLTIGGITGGVVASIKGLRYWMWWMVAAMNLPNLTYVFLSYTMPETILPVYVSVAIEQFGYGFGFTAYMLYQVYISRGKHETAHFAFCTGFMALGMMLPGMVSGWLQELIGYQHFFIWVMICTIPAFLIMRKVKVDPDYGIKKQ